MCYLIVYITAATCNYLFAVFFGLLFLMPYINSVLDQKRMTPWLLLPHMAVAVLFGGYLCLGALAIPATWLLMVLALGDKLHAVAGVALVAVAIWCHGGPAAGIRTGKTPRASISEKFLSALFGKKR